MALYRKDGLLRPPEKLFIAFVRMQVREDIKWFFENEKRIYMMADWFGVDYKVCDVILEKLRKRSRNVPKE